SKFKSNIILIKGELTANAKSILGILMLGAGYGEKLKLIVDGVDEDIALEEIIKLFENGFNE
ncbi:MAG: HPr family phosphocarrier protein, partial [bacterium]|nr:HPr family phosphocarrier protein [bacterium]